MTEPTKTGSRVHYYGLDNLRALAILLVLLYHCTPGDNPNRGISSIPAKLGLMGWSGVDLFFLLSGFLVTKFLVSTPINQDSLVKFYRNRLLRILPAYFVGLLTVFFIIPLVIQEPFVPLNTVTKYLFFINNYNHSSPHLYYSINASTGHFWSLAVELHFYLILPLILIIARKINLEICILILIILLVSFRITAVWNGTDANATYGTTHFKLDGLLLGSLVAINRQNFFLRSKLFSTLTIFSIVYLLGVIWLSEGSQIFKNGNDYYWGRSILPVAINIVFTALLIGATSSHNNALNRRRRYFSFLAKYSYGIYVFHFIYDAQLKTTVMPIIYAYFGDVNTAALCYFGIQLVISTLTAMASYHLIEKYFLKMKK